MDVFNTMLVMSLSSYSNLEEKLDFIKKLPVEIAIIVLRKLNGAALVNACRVSKYWQDICKMDRVLRNSLRKHLRDLKIRRQEIIFGGVGTRDFVPKNEIGAFKRRNKQNTVKLVDPESRNNPLRLAVNSGVAPQPRDDVKRKREDSKRETGISKVKKRRLLRLL